MTTIRVLEPHLTNMIAAGEVVERPSGIVKELIENALDAEAQNIIIRIQNGGMDSIEVSDDGLGMGAEDLRLAFERHSTSKIHAVNDLNHIASFGFRGEALPSIASVSRVVASTHDGQGGHVLTIDNGEMGTVAPFARNKGTSITVQELFLKTPARLKYIKNVNYETAIVLDIIQKFAAGRPDVSFTYTHNDKVSFRSFGTGQLKDVFQSIFGSLVAKDTQIITGNNYDFKLQGLMALPQHNRANRNSIWIYINGRMVRYPKIQSAVVEAYRRHMPHDRMPIAILKVEVDPQLVDVNVHPSKWQIRLSKEESLVALIEKVLAENLNTPLPQQRVQFKQTVSEPLPLDFNRIYEAMSQSNETVREPIIEIEETFLETLIQEPIQPIMEPETRLSEPSVAKIEPLRVLSQFAGKYILAQGDEGLYIIDQHAAMERVRYEYFQAKMLQKNYETQPLLVPLIFEGRGKASAQLEVLNQHMEDFQIQFELFSDTTLIVREVPIWMKPEEVREFVNNLLDTFEDEKTIREEDFRRKTLATLACHSSVRFNEYLSQEEMVSLISSLRKCEQPYHCPHGRPTYIVIDHTQLLREFKR